MYFLGTTNKHNPFIKYGFLNSNLLLSRRVNLMLRRKRRLRRDNTRGAFSFPGWRCSYLAPCPGLPSPADLRPAYLEMRFHRKILPKLHSTDPKFGHQRIRTFLRFIIFITKKTSFQSKNVIFYIFNYQQVEYYLSLIYSK